MNHECICEKTADKSTKGNENDNFFPTLFHMTFEFHFISFF